MAISICISAAWPVILRPTAGIDRSRRTSLFDRYQSLCQYHRPIDSVPYVWLNRKDGARPDQANSVSQPGTRLLSNGGELDDEQTYASRP